MIRFVDVRGQGMGARFSFWDTTRDTYCAFGGCQAWTSFQEFSDDFASEGGVYADSVRTSGIERFRDVCPDWVNDGKPDVDADDDVEFTELGSPLVSEMGRGEAATAPIDASLFSREVPGSMGGGLSVAELVGKGGTDLSEALQLALDSHPDAKRDAHVVVITDGELSADQKAAAVERFRGSPLLKSLGGDFPKLQSEHYDEPQADGSRIRKLRVF